MELWMPQERGLCLLCSPGQDRSPGRLCTEGAASKHWALMRILPLVHSADYGEEETRERAGKQVPRGPTR